MISKLDLARSGLPLQMYFFTVKKITGRQKPKKTDGDDFKVFMCYTAKEAMDLVRQGYTTGTHISVRQRGVIPVKDLVGTLNLPLLTGDDVPAFLSALVVMNERLVKDRKDQEELNRIITGLKNEHGN